MKRRLPICLLAILVCLSHSAANASDWIDQVNRGEFAAARQSAMGLNPSERRNALLQIASNQYAAGDAISASNTASQLDPSDSNSAAIRSIAEGGAGGGAGFADFQPIIDLIQATVAPDTWDALGGPSTMREYAQGVFVDPSGTLLPCETLSATDARANLDALLRAEAEGPEKPWSAPANLRSVSLKRLREAWTRAQLTGQNLDDAMVHLAGLSEAKFVFFTPDDIVIAGPSGGIELKNGWLLDRATRRAAIRMDFLAATFASSVNGRPFGCTIDPSTEGLQAAAKAAGRIQSSKLPIGRAAEAMVSAIGMQRIEIFGIEGDTAIGLMMVEADRHMKQLALGIHPMPAGGQNYLDMVDAFINEGLPNDLLLRLWFTAGKREVRTGQQQQVFELVGSPISLSGQNERAVASGARGNLTRDARTEAFVQHFNDRWVDIRQRYPVYAGLESVYQAASVAAVIRQYGNETHRDLMSSLAGLASDIRSGLPVPRQVETIAVLHKTQHARKRHNIVIASGGVSVRPSNTLKSKLQSSPVLNSITDVTSSKPDVIQRWWW